MFTSMFADSLDTQSWTKGWSEKVGLSYKREEGVCSVQVIYTWGPTYFYVEKWPIFTILCNCYVNCFSLNQTFSNVIYTERYFLCEKVCFFEGIKEKSWVLCLNGCKAEMMEWIQEWASESCDIWNKRLEVTMNMCPSGMHRNLRKNMGWVTWVGIFVHLFSVSHHYEAS